MEKEPLALAYYELRIYTFGNEKQKKLIEDFYSLAIPVLNRLQVEKVGIFNEAEPSSPGKLYVLLPYQNLEHFSVVNTALDQDQAFQKAAAAYLDAPANEPAYERIESSLMKAFKNFPQLIAPENKGQIFELRQYQSATEAAGKKKIEMFNDQGEIEIFKRLQFNPVFWGETIIGPERPNLTYMVTFDNLADKEAKWKRFIDDTQWKELSSKPEYANDLLINLITSTVLVPTSFSQL
ncbi:NIPSNAP family protein [Pedobacter sp. L105]|uniref:NIPSNAP family protein n=1 Tax=Pedobacter sp. L105 TaxID=1641871 RepID=UPI00131BC5A2|nr:NIPSNAP family protein [Pedobacter sp. L105]